jgi:hypothetical protein
MYKNTYLAPLSLDFPNFNPLASFTSCTKFIFDRLGGIAT